MDKILIRGARTHNLKNIDLTLPRDKLIVITGLSGSGKSSLAFDTLYAEGQRRYVESLSAYARQFLSMMEKPDVDTIEGLSPAISIEQKSTSHNPRSTVGTITEIYDYLRLLYARVGIPRCPDHDIPLEAQTVSQMVDLVLAQPEGSKLMLLAPVIRERKGEHLSVFEELRAQGFVRARVNGKLCELDELPKLDKQKKHSIDVVVDRFKVRADLQQRLAESFETALKLADGLFLAGGMGGDAPVGQDSAKGVPHPVAPPPQLEAPGAHRQQQPGAEEQPQPHRPPHDAVHGLDSPHEPLWHPIPPFYRILCSSLSPHAVRRAFRGLGREGVPASARSPPVPRGLFCWGFLFDPCSIPAFLHKGSPAGLCFMHKKEAEP